MKTIFTIVLGLVVVIASLICFVSSMCAVLNPNHGRQADFAICILLSLGVAITGVILIGKIDRKQ